MKKILFSFFLCTAFFSTELVFGVTKTWVSGATWSAATWSPAGAVAAGDDIIIPAGATLQIDVNTVIVNNVQVIGTLNFTANNNSDLKYSNNFTIETTGLVNNTGSIEKSTSAGTFTINGNGTYIHNPFNNILLDESMFYNGLESFSNTSNMTILKWYNVSVPLGDPTRMWITNFGNLTLSVNTTGLRWNQKGYFGVGRIKGTLTITDGIVEMDDGQGGSTSLILQNVLIKNTGALVVRRGGASSFNLTTLSFTDSSTSIYPTILADTTFCLYQWTATGNVQLGHYFIGMQGDGMNTGGDLRLTVNGNLTINGTSTCQFITNCDAPLRLTVTGISTIGGTPTKVRFVECNTGLLNFTTNDFVIAGGNDNVLFGGTPAGMPKTTGVATITINNDFSVTAASNSYIMDADTNTQKLTLYVGRDFSMSNTTAQLRVSNHLGANTIRTGRHFSITGGLFSGEVDTLNTAMDSLIIGGNFTFNSPVATNYCIINASKGNTACQVTGNFNMIASGTAVGQGVYIVYSGPGTLNMTISGNYVQNPGASQFNAVYNSKPWLPNGSVVFNVTGMFDQNGGFFRAINSQVNSNPSNLTFTANSIDYDGGYFNAYNTANNANGAAVFNITNNCKVNFTAATDSFMFVGTPYVSPDFCYLTTNVTIGGSLNISGANGSFVSSYAKNGEVYNIIGSVNISAGNNAFNPAPPVVSTTHKVIMNVGGSMTITGGNTFLSKLSDSLVVTINQDLVIASGTLSVKGGSGSGIVDVLGQFNMTGGTFFLHNNTLSNTTDGITVTINSDGNGSGDFTHMGGTINFDNYPTGNIAEPPTIVVKSPNYFIGGTGIMTRDGSSLVTGYFGELHFQRTGTTNFNRNSTTHNIQQVKQFIDNGTTLDVVNGNVQIASWNAAFSTDMLNIETTGTLALRTNSIKSNVTLPNSGITVYGRLALQHPSGFYNGTNVAALDATGGMNYILQVGSTVEYYGTANQTITGMNVGLATIGFLHKYYNLDINMGGAAYAFPTNTPNVNSVYVRHRLNLLAGELNLDSDHTPTNGGRSIIIEDSTTAAIFQGGGFIRSETQDGSGMVKWLIRRAPGNHVFPFGYSLSVNDRIPFTFATPSGNADTVMVSTYHSSVANLPYPPTVFHVRNMSGVDNSNNTVDRFWYINTTGPINNANMSFTVLSLILGSSVEEMPTPFVANTLRAQRWIPPNSWELAYQGVQSNPVSNGALVNGATLFPFWWTLSANNSPLPVQMLSFSGNCDEKNTCLKWTTASEINNDHFTITRSLDGVNYEAVGNVSGHGNSTTPSSYKYIDNDSPADYSYYKLVQIDFDGRSEEFGPVVVRNCKSNPGLDVVVAGSEAGNTNLMVQTPYDGRFHLDVFNSQGQLMLQTDVILSEGSNTIPLTSDLLSTGVYHVRLQGDQDVISKKVFISKN